MSRTRYYVLVDGKRLLVIKQLTNTAFRVVARCENEYDAEELAKCLNKSLEQPQEDQSNEALSGGPDARVSEFQLPGVHGGSKATA